MVFLDYFTIRNYKVSPKVTAVLQDGGGAAAMMAAIAGYIGTNHEIFWFIFGTIGSIAALTGISLNIQRMRLEKIEHKERMKKIKELP